MGYERENYLMCRLLKTVPIGLVTALAVLAHTFSAGAQQLGSIVGSLTDQMTLTPLVGASVSLMDHELSAVTNEDGHFVIRGVPTGDISVRMEQLGHIAVVVQVAVLAQEVAFVQAQLAPMALLLDELSVITDRIKSEYRTTGSSVAEFRPTEAESAFNAMELLRARVPSLHMRGGEGRPGERTDIQIRGSGSVYSSNLPSLYVDGMKAELEILTEIPSSDVLRIRVLKGPSASSEYQDAANGVILVETRTGRIRGTNR